MRIVVARFFLALSFLADLSFDEGSLWLVCLLGVTILLWCKLGELDLDSLEDLEAFAQTICLFASVAAISTTLRMMEQEPEVVVIFLGIFLKLLVIIELLKEVLLHGLTRLQETLTSLQKAVTTLDDLLPPMLTKVDDLLIRFLDLLTKIDTVLTKFNQRLLEK